MPLCSSGITHAKAGVVDNLVYTGGASGILGFFPGLEWLQPLGIALGSLAYYTPTLCATDPPASPSFTAAEYAAAALKIPGSDYTSFLNKLTDLLTRIVWFQMCECAAVATPAIGTAPTQPSGTQIVVGGSPGAPCMEFRSPSALATGTRVPYLGPFQMYGNTFYTAYTIPLDAPGSGTNSRWEVWRNNVPNFATAAFAGPALDGGNGVGTSTTAGFGVTASTQWWWLVHWNNGSTPNGRSEMVVQDWCGGSAPNQQVQPCDNSDLLAAIALLKTQVDLIQRQAAPFGYVYGTNHTGLTGTNEFTVADLIGVSVDVTTTPAYAGVEDGTPETLFDIGWVSLGTTDGWVTSRRIDHDGTLWLPAQAGVLTRVGYTLNPGVVVDIRELVREP